MFYRILAMGLMLGLLFGFAAVSPIKAAPPVKTLPVAGYTWRDIGPFNDYRFPWAEREKWRNRGHAAISSSTRMDSRSSCLTSDRRACNIRQAALVGGLRLKVPR